MQELRIGSVVSRSFSILFHNFLPFTFLTAIVYAPVLALSAVIPVSENGLESIGLNLLAALLYMVASATVIYGVVEELRGQRASMKTCVAVGLRQLVPVLGSCFVLLFCMTFGFVVFIIPGILVLLMLFVTVPVAVIERPGIFATLNRSSELTKGYKLQLLGICLLTWGLMLGLSMFNTAVDDALGDAAGLFATLVTKVFTGALGAVVTAVTYHDLRAIKEGVSVDDLVRVFE